jgi:putative redox protein
VKAVARRKSGFTTDVEVEGHHLVVDEPEKSGGANEGPSPTRLLTASLASCTAITIVMYAGRKGWDIGDIEVTADWMSSERGEPARFETQIKLPRGLPDEHVERLKVIAGKCPVHRALVGDVEIEDHIELV